MTPAVGATSSPTRREPTLATKAAVAVGFVLVLALCGGYAWWFLIGSQPSQRSVTFATQPRVRPYGAGGRGAANRQSGLASVMTRLIAGAPAGVRPIRDNEWFVKSGDAQMRVRGTGAAGTKAEATFQFVTPANVFPAEHIAMLRARAQILRNVGLATTLGVTNEQRKALSQADARADLVVSDTDRAAVLQRWTAYATASDPAAKAELEKPLLAALEDVGKRSLEPSKAALADRVRVIEAALKPEQWSAYKQRRR